MTDGITVRPRVSSGGRGCGDPRIRHSPEAGALSPRKAPQVCGLAAAIVTEELDDTAAFDREGSIATCGVFQVPDGVDNHLDAVLTVFDQVSAQKSAATSSFGLKSPEQN